MTCQEFVDFLAAYFDGELTNEQRMLFDEHLAECRDCSNYLDSFAKTRELAKRACRMPDDPVPAEVPEELIAAILQARKK